MRGTHKFKDGDSSVYGHFVDIGVYTMILRECKRPGIWIVSTTIPGRIHTSPHERGQVADSRAHTTASGLAGRTKRQSKSSIAKGCKMVVVIASHVVSGYGEWVLYRLLVGMGVSFREVICNVHDNFHNVMVLSEPSLLRLEEDTFNSLVRCQLRFHHDPGNQSPAVLHLNQDTDLLSSS